MKKLIYLLLLVPFLFGCEIYEDETYPQLSGQWILMNVELSNGGSVPDGSYHILNDTVVVQDYTPVEIDGEIIHFSQSYNDPNTRWYDKFIIDKTVWEFENNIVGIPTTVNGQRGYYEYSYYGVNKDLISGEFSGITIDDGHRHIQIVSCGLETIKLLYPRVWTMFRMNTSVDFFFQESMVLTFRRL